MHQARRGFLRVAVTVAAAAAVGAAQDQQQDQQQDTRTRIPGSSANKDPFGLRTAGTPPSSILTR